MTVASYAGYCRSGALFAQAEIGACQRLCPSIPLCLMLKGLDAVSDFAGVVPGGSGTLLEDPPPRVTNTLRFGWSGGQAMSVESIGPTSLTR